MRDVISVYLQESFRVLRSRRQLLLSIHRIWGYHPASTDYWCLTAAGLRKIITDAAFEVTDIQGMIGLAPLGFLLFQNAFLFKTPRFLRYIFVSCMQVQMMLIDKLHPRSDKMKDTGIFMGAAKKS